MDRCLSTHKLSCWLLLFLISIFSGMAYAEEPLVLGVHPYKTSSKLLKAYTPLANYLAKAIGRPIRVEISRDYKTHIDRIGRDELDIAYMGPASYVKLVAEFGEKPILARQVVNESPTFQGKIVVRQDSPIKTLHELKGKRFAFGDPGSTMSHLVPRFMLWQSGVSAEQLATYKFLGSHDNVALAVLANDYDAGAVKEAVYYKYKNRGLRALATTPALSEHLFVSSSRMPVQVIEALRAAFFALKDDPQGESIMSGIKKGITAYQSATNADYDNLREILTQLHANGVVD
jgi:phosphonate transport system substrate-binding protein